MITSDITQTDGIKVGLLIGANCIKALEPLKVISSVDGDLAPIKQGYNPAHNILVLFNNLANVLISTSKTILDI